MAQVIWANAAIDDLQRLREYFESASPRFAEKLMDQLISRTRMLADFPQSGRTVPEFEDVQLREVQSGNYRIIYRLEQTDKVEIARIFHSAQQLEKI
ncbi:type II toxin-antitoxin system RelE/ParE family toxin [Hymenobacter sp. IS2118]|uniref:type II toxin-antitoxin system RelE/ParE family toxin n=1 Tax=Hymenobacter sp. IS2118 TaxID=1505605 RepID=UPI000555C16C|nr:type II toxin-antitoxin system RelE/ParE family toxin [Hymenobacter sp. IS2118]